VTVKRVGIVGSGIMAAGLAEVAARFGHEVVLRSRSRQSAEAALDSLARSLARQVTKERCSPDERDETLGRVRLTTDLDGLADADLVIESVVEDLEVKRRLFADLDRACAPHAILASNTSTLPVVELAMQTERPDRVCGLHFFNPAPAMSLVEVVRPLTASAETIDAVREFAEACGKECVEVQDRAGFVVNALLFPYLNHAVALLERGVATQEGIDTAMRGGCGFPMGPFALLDLVGLDTAVAILDALFTEYRQPQFVAEPRLRRLVAAGHLGRKSGEGFYRYPA
jgi:3-hydroxybutyryl-CoA dehydrogenase